MFIYNEKFKSRKNGYYYSCPWIEHGLVFFPKKLAFCCYTGLGTGENPLIRDSFSGQKINYERINTVRNMYRNFHKKGKINSICAGCRFLEYKKWDNSNYIENLYISHWTECNAKCIYCYERENPEEFAHSSHYKVLPFIQEMHNLKLLKPGGMLNFGGGEPAVLDEFEDIINYLLDNFYWGIRVHTSGIKYSPAMARIVEDGRGYIVVSADSGSPEVYKQIKQKDSYYKVFDNLRRYALKTNYKNRGMVSAKYIIIPGVNDNKNEIEKWLKACYDAGLWTCVMDVEENWYKKHRGKIPKYIFDLIKFAEKRSKQMNISFEFYERMDNMCSEKKSIWNIKKPLL